MKKKTGDGLTRENMAKILSKEDLLVQDKRYILVWNHGLNHYSLTYLIRLYKRGVIPRKISKIRKPPPCVACMF